MASKNKLTPDFYIMNITIIGIINHDTITMSNGQVLEDLGGILYNTAVLANLVDPDTTVRPVSKIGADCYDMMQRIIQPYAYVDISGIAVVPEGTSRNTIRYDESLEKVEQLTNHIGPIPVEQIHPFFESDAFLVNFIIGDDISFETLQEIRDESRGLIYLDVHNLCLGIDDQGYRFQKSPGQWRDWMGLVDVVQMNEVEARLLAGKEMETDEDFITFGQHILSLGPSIFIATRGPLGSVTVYGSPSSCKSFICPPEQVDHVMDTTGCGDAFAAGFLTDYLATRDPVSATRLASWTAGINCTLAGLAEVGKFRAHRKA